MAIIKLDGGYNALPISYKRGNPIPLDTTAVWYDFDELQTYAQSGVTAYVGQVLSLVSEVKNEEGAVTGHTSTAYIIADTNGTLEPIGTAPIGDEKSIVVAEDGTVSLKGVDSLVFERDIIGEDGQPTGEKEEVQYQILMTKTGLTWVEPSKTTVEGLATLIEGLTQRVKALEDDHVGAQDLADAIKDFATTGDVTEATKDFVTTGALSEAIKDFATTDEVDEAVKVLADKIGVTPEGETKTIYELIAAEVLRATEAEGDLSDRIGVAKTDDADATGVYAYVDGVVEALVNGVDPEKIDSLNELIAWVEAHPAIVEELDGRLDKVEGILDGIGGEEEPATVKGYVEGAFAAHELAADGKYATQDALAGVKATAEAAQTAEQVGTAISTALESYSDTDAVNELIGVALEDYYTSEEVDGKGYAVAADVEKAYAKKATTLAGYGIADAYTATQTDEAIAAKIKEMTGGESAADVLVALNNYKASNDREVWGDEFVASHTVEGVYTPDYSGDSRVDKLATKLNGIEADAEVNTIVTVKRNGVALVPDSDRAVNIEVPTSITTLDGYTELDTKAQKGVDDAAAAQGTANANAGEISTLKGIVNGLKEDGTDGLVKKVAALETEVLVNTDARLDAVEAILTGSDTDDSDGLVGTVASHTTALTTLTTETIPGINATLGEHTERLNQHGTKILDHGYAIEALEAGVTGLGQATGQRLDAVEADLATIGRFRTPEWTDSLNGVTDPKLGDIATIVEAMDGASMSASLYMYLAMHGEGTHKGWYRVITDTDVEYQNIKWGVKNIAFDYLKAADKEELQGNIDALDAAIKAVIDDEDGSTLNSIKDLAVWVEEHETDVLPVIEKNTADIAAIYTPASGETPASGVLVTEVARLDGRIDAIHHAETGILALAKAYTDEKAVVADGTTIENKEGTLSVKAVSTDVLVQGDLELVLNGGSANTGVQA
jgi:hypothetical protein